METHVPAGIRESCRRVRRGRRWAPPVSSPTQPPMAGILLQRPGAFLEQEGAWTGRDAPGRGSSYLTAGQNSWKMGASTLESLKSQSQLWVIQCRISQYLMSISSQKKEKWGPRAGLRTPRAGAQSSTREKKRRIGGPGQVLEQVVRRYLIERADCPRMLRTSCKAKAGLAGTMHTMSKSGERSTLKDGQRPLTL